MRFIWSSKIFSSFLWQGMASALFLWGALGLMACARSEVYFDPAFTKTQLEAIQYRIKDLSRKKIVLSETYKDSFLGQKYLQLFGATRGGENAASGFVDYFQKRVSYVLPSSVEVFAPQKVVFLSNVWASNLGPLFWYNELSANRSYLGSLELKMVSPRVGLILLGAETLKKQHVSLEFLGILIHEARHTDCVGQVARADLNRYNEGMPMDNYDCGYPHIVCPPGSDLEGLFACDAQVWGTYAIQALTMHSIATACENCATQEKTTAEALFLEALTRVEGGSELFRGAGPVLVAPLVSQEEHLKITEFSKDLFNRRLHVVNSGEGSSK